MSDLAETYEDAIAVVGMACRFPGAPNVKAFWDLLRDGGCAVRRFSREEALQDGADPAELALSDHVCAFGVLDDADCFDADYFGVSRRDALAMDPQHRLFLECAATALEDAGYDPHAYGGAIGVFAGSTASTYHLNALARDPAWTGREARDEALYGNFHGFLSTRLSYLLNLTGPSIAVQTACSTSLVAAHLACQSLLNFECDMAFAGGVSVQWPQHRGYVYEPGGIYAKDGVCRPFDANATGVVFGNGVGLVVLKRLAEAIEAGDHIEGVILGSAINNDGDRKVGYTAPSVGGQAQVVRMAQSYAGVAPDDIGFIEAHGTGTALGDPIEVRALTESFRTKTERSGFCMVSSVKSNIGHLDAAAGVASLIKAILSVKHGEIPGTASFKEPNPELVLDKTPFKVSGRLTKWPEGGEGRIAGVSSFGFGGTNAHMIVRDWPASGQDNSPEDSLQIIPLSARAPAGVERLAAEVEVAARGTSSPRFSDYAYTLQTGRAHSRCRQVIVAQSFEDVAAARKAPASEIIRENLPAVFLFTGQGSQYVGMAAGLYEANTVFRSAFDQCADLFTPLLGRDIRAFVLGKPEDKTLTEDLTKTQNAQAALFALEYALCEWWLSIGVAPIAMAGHSIGEYVAACRAGVFSLENAARLVAERGRVMQAAAPGAMLAVPISETDLAACLPSDLDMAAFNGAELSVASGPVDAIERFAETLSADGVAARRLKTSHAFHSRMMDEASDGFLQFVRTIDLAEPRERFVSTVTGDWARLSEVASPDYWARQIRKPVRFVEAISRLRAEGPAAYVEVGPGRALAGLVKSDMPAEERDRVIYTLPHADETSSADVKAMEAAGEFWRLGGTLTWTGFHDGARRRVSAPTYPFHPERYSVKARLGAASSDKDAALIKRTDPDSWTYVPSWMRTPALPITDQQDEKQWLLLADEAGLADRIADLVRKMRPRDKVVCVKKGQEYRRAGDGVFEMPLDAPGVWDQVLGDAFTEGGPHYIVHCWSAEPPASREAATLDERLTDMRRRQSAGLFALVHLVQALERQGSGMQTRLIVVSQDAYSVLGETPSAPGVATALGLVRCVALETGITARTVDVSQTGPSGDGTASPAAHIVAETLSDEPCERVAYRNGQRWLETAAPFVLPQPSNAPRRLRKNGVYLLTGGFGGLGGAFADYLARTVKAKLILTTRRPVEEFESDIQNLEAAGAEVLALQADAADPAAMAAAIKAGRDKFGDIHGAVHAAGLAGGGVLALQSSEAMWRAMQAKVAGAVILYEELKCFPPDFILLCSSLAAQVGAPGRTDYAAANLFLDAFAEAAGQGSPLISVNWDMWSETGMGVEAAGSSSAHGSDVTLSDGLSTSEGLDMFARILDADISRVMVSTRDLNAAMMGGVFSGSDAEGDQQSDDAEDSDVQDNRLSLSADYVAPRDDVEQKIADIWKAVLGAAQIGIHDDYFELGGDSLLALRIAARLRKSFNGDIGPQTILEALTVSRLSDALRPSLKAASAEDKAAQLKAKIANMSPEEVKALLAQKKQAVELRKT